MRFLILIILITLTVSRPVTGQGMIINPGVTVVNKGNFILKRNWINNGLFSDTSGTVIFSGTTQTIEGTASADFYNISVESGSITTISTAGQKLQRVLLSNGILNANSNLTLLSTASRTALIDGSGTGQVTGNLTMQRYLPSGYGYKYFSSPFQAAKVSEFGDDMNLASPFTLFYRYDENRTSSGWVGYKYPDSLLRPMRGYAVNFGSNPAANTVDIAGVVNNGSLSLSLYNNNQQYTKGFNLIGNPYPSPIDWNAASGWTKTNIDNALYYFKASTTDQYGGMYSSYIGGVSSDGLATNIIPSMQGFFVHVTNGSYPVTGMLGMNNNIRITDMTHAFTKSGGKSSIPLLRLTATFLDNSLSPDPAVIYFDEKATSDLNGNLDALKLMNTDLMVPNLYTLGTDGSKFSIRALPVMSDTFTKVPLGLKINRDGYIIFKIRNIDFPLSSLRIYLTDFTAGTEQDLLPDKEYKLFLTSGEYLNRFYLNFSDITTETPENIIKDDFFSIYSSHGLLLTEIKSLPGETGNLNLYNLTGQIVFTKKIYEPGYYEFDPGTKEGIYIVSYISGLKRSSKKIYVQNR